MQIKPFKSVDTIRGHTKFRARYPEVPWRDVADLRNRLIHGYDAVDFDILWAIIQRDLPPLIRGIGNNHRA